MLPAAQPKVLLVRDLISHAGAAHIRMEKPNGRGQPQIAFGGEHNLTNRPHGTHEWELNLELVVLLAYIWLPVEITGPIYGRECGFHKPK